MKCTNEDCRGKNKNTVEFTTEKDFGYSYYSYDYNTELDEIPFELLKELVGIKGECYECWRKYYIKFNNSAVFKIEEGYI